MSTREDLATALTNTGVVRVTPNYRSTIKPSEGFIKWAGRTPDDSGLGFLDRWEAWICLSQDIGTAEAWLEARLDALLAAVNTEALVTLAEPSELQLGANTINGLIIEAVAVADPPAAVADPVTPFTQDEV